MEKQYEYQTEELAAQAFWNKENIYNSEQNPGALYSVDTPPPTVSGKLHIGHIFSYTQTDIIARFNRMNGASVFYPFGFDDNGLPTERFVEKETKVRAHQIGRSAFIALCLEQTEKVELEFKNLWQRMGLSVDWDFWYSTISSSVRRLSQASFIDLYNKGFIYRQDEPALYCPACRTAVAQAELDDKESASSFNDIVFSDAQGNSLLIGTTRPELLPSCVALLYHPTDTRYQHLKGTLARTPLFDITVPILEDEAVNPEKGTGLVMCCTFGDKTDIEWYKKFKLPYKQSIGLDGKMMPHADFMAGLKTAEARAVIIERLKAEGRLVNQKPITHTVSVHERCKNEIEFVVLKQWFINIIDHKQELLDVADQIEWYPAFMKSRYINWVENIGWNWCISRQRFFGIPFPVWHCTSCQHSILADPHALPLDPQESAYNKPCPSCGSLDLAPDTDVMDTWNTSSITPYIVRELYNQKIDNPFEESSIDFIPMSMRPQAHDIIRTWAFYTIVKTWFHHKTVPWKQIIISGHVLTGDKSKISKSQGNAPLDPINLLQSYPADVIRYWTASGNLGHDVAFSETQLKIGFRLLTKLWNAFRFIVPHIQTVNDITAPPAHLSALSEWILHKASETFKAYTHYFERQEFGLALDCVERFFWNDFCDNYLEMIKNQLFNPDQYTADEVEGTRLTLAHLGMRLLQLYAPYIPHVCESLYSSTYKQLVKTGSIHQTRFTDFQYHYEFSESQHEIALVISVISMVRKLKSENQLSLKVPLITLEIGCSAQTCITLQKYAQLISGSIHAQALCYNTKSPGDSSRLEQQGEQWYGFIAL